jgi:hypothetical protein
VLSFIDEGSKSLIVAKPDRVEVWDVDKTGLVHRAELELWGSVVAIEKVDVSVSRSSASPLTAGRTASHSCSAVPS